MSVTKQNGRWRFHFNRIVNGRRVRATKLLPKGWDAKRADEYDKKETSRLYALASGQKQEPLIEEAVLLYIQNRLPEIATGKEVERQLAQDLNLYQGKHFDELPEVLAAIKKDNVSPRTKQARISYIRAACRYAYKYHKMGDKLPGVGLALPQVHNERQVYATRQEMLSIAKHCRKSSRPYIRIAFYSGMRLGEILRAEIVGDAFVLKTTKNKSPRIIPIHPKINSVARKYMPVSIAKTTVQDHYREARKAAGLEHVRFHDLRHSAASEMINAGVDLYTVGAVLGHRDARSTKRYAHLSTKSLEEAIRKIG